MGKHGLVMKLNWLFSVLRRIGNIPAMKRRWNEIGELVDFCLSFNLVISGTIFQHLDIHKLKWKSPDDKTINQTDNIMTNKKLRNSSQDIREYQSDKSCWCQQWPIPSKSNRETKALRKAPCKHATQAEYWYPKTEFSWLNKMAHRGQDEFNTVYPNYLGCQQSVCHSLQKIFIKNGNFQDFNNMYI